MNKQITVRVPATTSNLGPGFDALGVALRLYNFVALERTPGTGANLPIVREAAELFFRRSRQRRFSFRAEIRGDVPVARGLGSSVSVRLGVLHGLNELTGAPLSRLELYRLAATLEGHPDNAAPASFGGFNIVRADSVQTYEISLRLSFVLLIPELEVETAAARRLLPATISHREAVRTAGNAAAIAGAFAARQYEMLRGNFGDGLHQPFRRKLVPCLEPVIAAAERSGALGGFLSGSGSTICAVTLQNAAQVASAMKRASPQPTARVIVTRADNAGVRV